MKLPTIDHILAINNPAAFGAAALAVFRWQSVHCAPYRLYMEAAGIDPAGIQTPAHIPFLPIEIFKSSEVYCCPTPPEKVFTSSSTGGTVPSRHPMARLSDYEKTFTAAFSLFYGDPSRVGIFALLPGYLEREGSSLIYMVDRLIARGGGGFYLHDTERLLRDIDSFPGPKILLGVTYALLDLAGQAPRMDGVTVMETGGMKGHREELPKQQLHEILCAAFQVGTIHSEYGMAELTSQAYSAGDGIFRCPPWMRVVTRDINDPFDILSSRPATAAPAGGNATFGGINIIDLANLSSCAFIQTQDIGTLYPDGSFTVAGRIDRSETRGCNLLVQ